VLVLNFIVVQRSYQKMDETNKANYFEMTQYFANYFDTQISKLAEHALNISIDRKIIRENVENSTWDTIQAVKQTLVDYRTAVPFVELVGIYFKDSDYVLTSGYKYSLDRFIEIQSKGNLHIEQEIENFLRLDHDQRIVIFSTFGKLQYWQAKLYVGIPVSINDVHDTLVFYILDHNGLKASFLGELGYENLGLFIFDSNRNLLYTNGNIEIGLLNNEEFYEFFVDRHTFMFEYNYDDNYYNVFKYNDGNQERIFLSVILRDEVEQNLKSFYKTIRNTLVLTTIGLILLLAMSVYVSYRPILKLSKRVQNSVDSDFDMVSEIGLIERAFDRLGRENETMLETISEQRMILIDYIFNNLLNGIAVSKNDIDWLNNNVRAKKFCVVSVLDLRLNNKQRALVVKEIFDKYDSYMYISDMLYEKCTALICAISDGISQVQLINGIEEILKKLCGNITKIGVGNMVDDLNNIRSSYLNSLYALDGDGTIVFFEDLSKTLPAIEHYPAENVIIFLNYVKNGEKEAALAELENIRDYISRNVVSVLTERYICYEILRAYIKTLKHIDMQLTKQENDDILGFNNIDEMCKLLVPTIVRICDDISNTKKDNRDEFNDSIVEYVDNNFTDQNLSLMQVADNYNISIYTLSRLFKEITGVGFKEYVTEKRIELSKHLLSTTDKKVAEIAAEVGFGSVSHFIRVFKSNCGVSPSQYNKHKVTS